MNSKRRNTVILVSVILVLGTLLFISADFHVARFEDRCQMSTSSGKAMVKALGREFYPQGTWTVVIEGPESAQTLIADYLERELHSIARGLTEVNFASELPPQEVLGSVLYIEITGGKGLWTPFYARYETSFRWAHGTDQKVEWINSGSDASLGTFTKAGLRIKGSGTVYGSSPGVISYKAYDRHRYEVLVDRIITSITETYASIRREAAQP